MSSAEQQRESLNIQLLVDSIPALIHTARPDGYIDYFNKRWLEYFGRTLDEVAGWNWTDVIHPEDVEGIVAKWRACLVTGEIFEYETRVRGANGEYRWMFHRKVPLRDANGNIVKWYGSSMDIHERKTGEEALRSSQAYLAEAQRLSHTGSWAWNVRTDALFWSEEIFRIYGYSPQETGPTWEKLLQRVHPKDRPQVEQRAKMEATGNEWIDSCGDFRIILPDGTIKYLHSVAHPITQSGEVTEVIGTVMDVTEQELLTQELRRREAYLTEAQKLSHTGSFGWKPDTGEIVWSDETFRIFEYDRSVKPTIDSVVQRVHPQDRADCQRVIDSASRGATDFEHTYRLLLPDGRVKHVHAVAHVVQDASGNREFVGAATDITERKKAKEALEALSRELQESKTKLEEAQRITHVGYWEWDISTGRVNWSDETYRIYGMQPQERPMDIAACQEKIYTEDWQRGMEEALGGGARFNAECRVIRPTGEVRIAHFQGDVERDASGQPYQMFGTIQDITDRKRAEDKIREQEAELHKIVDLVPQLVAVFGPGGERLYANRIGLDYVGLSLEEWRQTPGTLFMSRSLIHPDDRARDLDYFDRALSAGSAYELELRLRKGDGTYRWFLVRFNPWRDAQGQVARWYAALTDIEDRKRAEDKIREQESELRQILDLAPQIVAVFGPNRERLYANHVLLDYLGVSLEAWRKMSDFGEIVHPDDREQVLDRFDRAYSTGSAFEAEARLRKGDGSYRWFLGRYSPLHDDKGQITRWFSVVTDIDERKKAEQKLQQENVALREEIDKASMFEEIVGTSPALKSVLSRISKVAPSDSTVLITGETGTGKELVARAIHRRSDRASRPFVSVNCAATPRELIASELFGHEKGAFTGATQQRLGRFELANGGTLFLDEVGELPAETQIALLRVLQEHEFERVGGTRAIRADVRVIAATNRDLETAISAGAFRSDLFYRLHVFPIAIPPLRERKEDIPLLVEYFIDRYARKIGKRITTVDKKTLRLLESYPWPGNIRELQNVIERSVIVCETANFSVDESWLSQQPIKKGAGSQLYLSGMVAAQEKEIIEAALRECQGRVFGPSGAAAKLGIARGTLESKIRSLKIDKKRFKA